MTPESDADAAAFSEMFDRCFDDIWGYVRRRVNDGSDADDVTAEVFSVAWRRRGELPVPDERRLWLFGVAQNVVRNHHRSVFRQLRLAGRLAGLAETNGAGIDLVERNIIERDETLWHALAKLSDPDRELLLMRAWDGLGTSEIAVILECTPNAASVRLTKARAKLQRELGKKDPVPLGHEVHNPAARGETDD